MQNKKNDTVMSNAEFVEMIDEELRQQPQYDKAADRKKASAPATEDENGEEEEEGEKINPVREIFSWILTFAVAIAVTFLIKNYLIINANVPTGSMENTIIPGDRLIGNRLSYIKNAPQRGDIVIFHYPDDENDIYVKRVIGIPGDTIEIRDAKVYLNGSATPLEEDYLKEEWVVATGPYYFEVPEDGYFMMGDNRNDSWDARYWEHTFVMRDKLLGKALFTYWPVADWGKLR